MSTITNQELIKQVDPDQAPRQFAILVYIADNCCMPASATVVRDGAKIPIQTGTVATAIRRLKEKGAVIEYRGRYHYYTCDNYEVLE